MSIVTKARVGMQLTQKDMAQLLGVSFVTVNNWENGRNVPQPHHAARLADLLGLDKQKVLKNLKTLHGKRG